MVYLKDVRTYFEFNVDNTKKFRESLTYLLTSSTVERRIMGRVMMRLRRRWTRVGKGKASWRGG